MWLFFIITWTINQYLCFKNTILHLCPFQFTYFLFPFLYQYGVICTFPFSFGYGCFPLIFCCQLKIFSKFWYLKNLKMWTLIPHLSLIILFSIHPSIHPSIGPSVWQEKSRKLWQAFHQGADQEHANGLTHHTKYRHQSLPRVLLHQPFLCTVWGRRSHAGAHSLRLELYIQLKRLFIILL